MTPFQQILNEELNKIAHKNRATIICSTYDCEPNTLIGHEIGDKYIETTINKNDLTMVVYIYTDEASVKIEDSTIMFELPDYETDENLLGQALVAFVQKAIDGDVAE